MMMMMKMSFIVFCSIGCVRVRVFKIIIIMAYFNFLFWFIGCLLLCFSHQDYHRKQMYYTHTHTHTHIRYNKLFFAIVKEIKNKTNSRLIYIYTHIRI